MSIIRSALSKVAASSTLESVGKPAWVQMWVRKGSTHAVGAAPIEKIAIFDPHLELPTLSTVNIRLYALQLYGTLPYNWEDRDR